jgi:bacterioferritin-associated ferredoxin
MKSKNKIARAQSNDPTTRWICTCNKITQAKIEGAIQRGCQTLPKIFTATTAGVGQCGGSCRPTLEKMLSQYLADGTFPENPLPSKKDLKKK